MTTRDKFLLVGLAAFAAGAGAGFLSGQQLLRARYEEIAESEIHEAKLYYKDKYKQTYKAGEYETPEGAAKALGIDVDLPEELGVKLKNPPSTPEAAAAMIKRLQGYQPDPTTTRPEKIEVTTGDEMALAVSTEDPGVPEIVIERLEGDVFVNGHVMDVADWDQDLEESKRTATDANGDRYPYIISRDEFRENDKDYEQAAVTYFEGDDIAAGSDDKPIEDVETILGEDNLNQFGHGSRDPNVVYIRNDKIEVDFEVTKSNGSYGKEVMGFMQHEDSPRLRRFRPGDDE